MSMRRIIRTNGAVEDLHGPHAMADLREIIGADALDTVTLRQPELRGHVMLVDDAGHDKALPVNTLATAMYLANCVPGTMHRIRGDVVVVPDDDFGGCL